MLKTMLMTPKQAQDRVHIDKSESPGTRVQTRVYMLYWNSSRFTGSVRVRVTWNTSKCTVPLLRH